MLHHRGIGVVPPGKNLGGRQSEVEVSASNFFLMGEIVAMHSKARITARRQPEKRRLSRKDYVRGQQILADAIFHWKNDPGEDARACVRVLMNHVATKFRADDGPLHPRPLERALDGPAGEVRGEPAG